MRDVGRIAVVDWDVHHGNGTETIFLADPNVLAISLHQDEHYPPGRGRVDVVGEGAARGANLNIPLPPGSGIAAYGLAFERVVVPALRAFRPELIVVASGFDASAYDPLGRMDLNADDFRSLTAALMEVAADVCDGRLLMSHEGGYSSFYVPVLRPGRDRADERTAQRHRTSPAWRPTAIAAARARSRRTSAPRSSAQRPTSSWCRNRRSPARRRAGGQQAETRATSSGRAARPPSSRP